MRVLRARLAASATALVATTMLAGLAAASPDAPFAIAQSLSGFGPNKASMIANDAQSFLATQTGSAWAAASLALATATAENVQEIDREYRGDPNQLANEFFTAAATPTWYSVLPTNVRAYVSAVAAAQASIATRDALATVSEPSPNPEGIAAQPTASGKSGAEARGAGVVGALVAAAGAVGAVMV